LRPLPTPPTPSPTHESFCSANRTTAIFAAKARLVEYLHLHHGYDVVLIESCFFSLTHAWDFIAGPSDVDGLLRPNVYPFWRSTRQVEPLWRLIRERVASDRPLCVGGVDPRHVGRYAPTNLVNELESSMRRLDRGLVEEEVYLQFRQLQEKMLEQEFEHKVSALDRER